MNKDIRKYIANCVLCQREKAKNQHYPLQMTEIPDRPFNKIAIDLVTKCETSTSGNKNILTIIDHLTGWPEAFPIPDKSMDTSTHVPTVHLIGQWNRIQEYSTHVPTVHLIGQWNRIQE